MVDRAKTGLVRSSRSYQVPFAHFTLTSTLYDIDVPGYKTETKNRLRLFDLDSVDSSIIKDGINFDKTDIAHNLTLFLYPDDSDRQGELLRIFQQYFMVSNGAQLIIEEAIEKGSNLHDLADYAVVQINDTHPSMVIPELIRLLTARGIELDEAISIVRSMTAYTNHTILAEALEKMALLNSWKKWFLTWYQSSKNWTVELKQNTKTQLFKLSMRADVFTWLTWISTTDTVLTG